MEGGRYSIRTRKQVEPTSGGTDALERLLAAAGGSSRLVVFSGSGLSASSGMSTFSTKGGLYERAQARFGLQDGKRLFCYTFFDKQRQDVQPFFADIYKESTKAKAAAGHHAISAVHQAGKLLRHYTLNIDGLAEAVRMDTWHPNFNPEGITVEMHGSIRQLVCPECSMVRDITPALLRQLRSRQALPCTACSEGKLRWRVMMYDDDEGEVITPDGVFDMLEEDMEAADCVLWVGLSFEQSASTAYFRRVRAALLAAGRLAQVPQFVINPSDEAHWNLMSSCCNQSDLQVCAVTGSSDEVLPEVAAVMTGARSSSSSSRAAAATAASAQQKQHLDAVTADVTTTSAAAGLVGGGGGGSSSISGAAAVSHGSDPHRDGGGGGDELRGSSNGERPQRRPRLAVSLETRRQAAALGADNEQQQQQQQGARDCSTVLGARAAALPFNSSGGSLSASWQQRQPQHSAPPLPVAAAAAAATAAAIVEVAARLPPQACEPTSCGPPLRFTTKGKRTIRPRGSGGTPPPSRCIGMGDGGLDLTQAPSMW